MQCFYWPKFLFLCKCCLKYLMEKANSVDPDQTAGAVWSGSARLHISFCQTCWSLKFLDIYRISIMKACPSLFCFQMMIWVNINGFSLNLVCALILWRSDLGLLMGKLYQILTELTAWDTPIFSFLDDTRNLSKCQGILTKLGTWINIKETWFGVGNGQISSIFDSYMHVTR